jgi:hypothetical protein
MTLLFLSEASASGVDTCRVPFSLSPFSVTFTKKHTPRHQMTGNSPKMPFHSFLLKKKMANQGK